MARPVIDDTEHVTAIAAIMLDGDFDRRNGRGWPIVGVDYFTARERVIDKMRTAETTRHSIRWRLDRKFREITRTKDQNGVPPDLLRLVAIDARLPGMIERHPELAAEINLDRLTEWRRWYPDSLAGWLRVQLDVYPPIVL
jgi:hypothetical protein